MQQIFTKHCCVPGSVLGGGNAETKADEGPVPREPPSLCASHNFNNAAIILQLRSDPQLLST